MPLLAPYVWCGAFSEGSFEVPNESVHIYLWPRLDPDYQGDPTGWFIRVVLDDISPGQPIELPSETIDFAQPSPVGADIFAVADLDDFSSAAPTSSGSIVFAAVPCVDGAENVSFEIDVILGAESGEANRIAVSGTFAGGANEPPQRDIYRP